MNHLHNAETIFEIMATVEANFPLECERLCANCGRLEGDHTHIGSFCDISGTSRFSATSSVVEGKGALVGPGEEPPALPGVSQRPIRSAGLGRGTAVPQYSPLPSTFLGRCDYVNGYNDCTQRATVVFLDDKSGDNWHEFEYCVDHYRAILRERGIRP